MRILFPIICPRCPGSKFLTCWIGDLLKCVLLEIAHEIITVYFFCHSKAGTIRLSVKKRHQNTGVIRPGHPDDSRHDHRKGVLISRLLQYRDHRIPVKPVSKVRTLLPNRQAINSGSGTGFFSCTDVVDPACYVYILTSGP